MNTFVTQYNYSPGKGSLNNGEYKLKNVGYVSANEQIDRLRQAGYRLDAYRRGEYEFESDQEIPEGYQDPTRYPGFDPADASRFAKTLAEKFDAIDEENKRVEEEQPTLELDEKEKSEKSDE